MHYFIGGSWMITMGSYMLHTLSFDGTKIGTLNSLQAIISIFAAFFAGVAADKYLSVDRYLSFTYLLNSFALTALAFTDSYSLFFFFASLNTMLFAPSFSLINSFSFYHIPSGKVEKIFPRVRLWGTIGWIIAGLIVGSLSLDMTNKPFIIGAFVSFLLGLFCFLLPATPPLKKESSFSLKSMLGIETLRLAARRDFFVLLFSTTLICIPVVWYYFFTNAFLNEIGFSNAAAKMTMGQMVELLMLFLLPIWLGRFRLKTVILIGFTAWATRFFLFTLGIQMNATSLLYIAILMHGIAHTFAAMGTQIWLDKNTPAHLRNSIQAILTVISSGISPVIGALLAGWIVDFYLMEDGSHDWQQIWLIPGFIGVSAVLIFWIFFRVQKQIAVSSEQESKSTL